MADMQLDAGEALLVASRGATPTHGLYRWTQSNGRWTGKQLATVNVPEARLITVQPYDAASIKAIEKAIMESDVGLTPSNDGRLIRLSIPELNEERRRELVKVVRGLAEDGKISIRNVRRDIMHDLKSLKDDGDVGADDERRGEGELQKLTDAKIAELDVLLKGKEEEILEV